MSKVIYCDLDGTLANCEHRQHHVRGPGKKDWKAFFEGMNEDALNEPLNEVLRSLKSAGYPVIFVTARPANYYGKTIRWLYEVAGWGKDDYKIYMRKAGDFRADNIVKKELLDQMREDGHEPLVVFDDRKQVVDMWRENGVFCCQVADHSF